MASTITDYFSKLEGNEMNNQWYNLSIQNIPNLIKKYQTGLKALDYGCAGGRFSMFLRSLGLDVNGVDIKDEMIEIAKKNDPNGQYNVIKSGQIPAIDGYYDFVFVKHVLLEIQTKDELQRVLKEINRVLKEGGTLMVIDNNADDFYNNDWPFQTSQFEGSGQPRSGCRVKMCFLDTGLTIYDTYWSAEDYQEVMKNSGFRVVEIDHPLGRDGDGFEWGLAKEKSPYTTYVAKKVTSWF